MNKIRIVNDIVEFKSLDDTIECSWKEKKEETLVNTVKIIVHDNTKLDIDYNISEDTKLDVFINIKENSSLELNEIVNGENLKIQYRIYLEKNSLFTSYKTSDLNSIKESAIINLNGENSKIKRVIKTISKNDEQYDMMVYHNAKNTESDFINRGVNIKDGKLNFNVSSFVPKDNIGCNVNQSNRIINLTNNECIIKPNMYIDCFDVTANHSALVGGFKDYEMFYLQSRGIKLEDSLNLLIHGFLVSELPDSIKENLKEKFNKYWR